ncbi:MAG: DUF805 domain-containing protein [Abditibacteriota bacterium]|nr:DUF805 domain-containing protein [Abditibacteriota bacterium]
MLTLFQRFWNSDNKASRLEFYIYTIFSLVILYLSLLAYVVFSFKYNEILLLFSFIGLTGLSCALFRRGKDRGMSNEVIINYLGFISLLIIVLWAFMFLNDKLYNIMNFGWDFNPGKDDLDGVLLYVFIPLIGLYALIFLFPILFFKGENQKSVKEKYANLRSDKPIFPKIGEVFNRDFFVNIFNFKGITKREGFWVYSPFVLFNIIFTYFVGFGIYYYYLTTFVDIGNFDGCVVWGEPTVYTWQPWVIIGLCVLTLALCYRRLRDLNIRPWKVVFLLIPPVNIFLFILMIFGKSEEKKN